jgi:integrase
MAGLDPTRIHPHRFRHTNAHDFLLAGGQERDLKRLMGWRCDTCLSAMTRPRPTTGLGKLRDD